MTDSYVVVWWMNTAPHAARFARLETAQVAAQVRNGLLLTVRGEVHEVVDYWRRDEKGEPMPAEWRDIAGESRPPCLKSRR